jgi:hypothetical protein
MARNKYHARQVIMGKLKFASRAEAARYLILADQQRRGEIRNLAMQVRYDLPAGITYRADFSYDRYVATGDAWLRVVEDVKGFETAAFRIKKRLFEDRYNMPLEIVRMRSRDVNTLLRAAGIV